MLQDGDTIVGYDLGGKGQLLKVEVIRIGHKVGPDSPAKLGLNHGSRGRNIVDIGQVQRMVVSANLFLQLALRGWAPAVVQEDQSVLAQLFQRNWRRTKFDFARHDQAIVANKQAVVSQVVHSRDDVWHGEDYVAISMGQVVF